MKLVRPNRKNRGDVFSSSSFISTRIGSIARSKDSSLFRETMEKIDFYRSYQRTSQLDIERTVEHDPKYLFIVDANQIFVNIDEEIDLIHSCVKTISQIGTISSNPIGLFDKCSRTASFFIDQVN